MLTHVEMPRTSLVGAQLFSCAILTPKTLRSAEGWSAAAGEATELPSSPPPLPHPDTRSPSPSAQDLTHPSGNGLAQTALESVASPTLALVFFFAFLSML